MAENKETKRNNQETPTPALEWVFAALGALMVAGVIGFLIYQVVTDEGKPPDLSVKVESVTPNGKGFLVEFAIENAGDQTAADVVVEGEIKKSATDIETADVTVSYVAARSESKGGLFFAADPRESEFKIRAKGYNNP